MMIWTPREVASTVLCCTQPGYNGQYSNFTLFASLDVRALVLYLPVALRMTAMISQHLISHSMFEPLLTENQIFGHFFGGGLWGVCVCVSVSRQH